MPELPEVEFYRRLAERTVGRTITSVSACDPWFLKGGIGAGGLEHALIGSTVCGVMRIGKLLLLACAHGRSEPVLGLRFGMTGRLLVDGVAAIDQLLYSTSRNEPAWDRFRLGFGGGGDLLLRDPRRLGGVSLNPNVSRLGPDALNITRAELRAALGTSRSAVKACLLDQSRIAGIGNLLADELLWRTRIDPRRTAGELDVRAQGRLHRAIAPMIAELIARGGSHLGDLTPHRVRGGRCPRDHAELSHAVVGGRSTWWCPRHQI